MAEGAALNVNDIYTGDRVVTRPEASSTRIIARPDLLANRRSAPGTVEKPLKNYENAWWVRHDDDTVAPYHHHEMNAE